MSVLVLALAGVAAALGAAALALVGRRVLRTTYDTPPSIGANAALGREATVRRRVGRPPQGFVAGAWWTLRAASGGPLADGDLVWVVEVDLHRFELVVERLHPSPTSTSDPEGNHR